MGTIPEKPTPRRFRAKSLVLAISLLINVAFVGFEFFRWFNSESGRVGQLTRAVEAGSFSDGKVWFRLPSGLTVRDASPRGLAAIGMFEANRFSIVVTTDDLNAVDYAVPRERLHEWGNLYSMDNREPEGAAGQADAM